MNKAKYENTILAILKIAPGLGNIQVRKALCIADAVHYSLHKESITGVRYIKERFGPVPDRNGYACLVDMVFDNKIINEEVYAGYGTENHYYAQIEPDYTLFTESQISIINYAAKTAMNYRAGDLSLRTHDIVYENTAMWDEIPLSAICKPEVKEHETQAFTEEERENARKFFESMLN